MKNIWIVQSGFQDGPEVFSHPKKAYDFVIKICKGIADSVPTYRKFLKIISENKKNENLAYWSESDDRDDTISVVKKEINPIY